MAGRHRRAAKAAPTAQLRLAVGRRVLHRGKQTGRHDAGNDRAQAAADRRERKGAQ